MKNAKIEKYDFWVIFKHCELTYDNIGTFDFFFLWLGASHGLLYFHRPTYFTENTDIEKYQGNVRKKFGQQSFGHEIVVDHIVAICP